MRKYQQLLLVVVSVFCIIILLMYKSENTRLKDVLQIVNFVGRKDEANLIKIETNKNILLSEYDYASPLPVWQHMGNDFYSYSSYWVKNNFAKGGKVITIVVGLEHSIVQFNCNMKFEKGIKVGGKFGFIRVFDNIRNTNQNFIIYKFLCRINHDYGTPIEIIYNTNQATLKQYILPVRDTRNLNKSSSNLLNICLDLNQYELTNQANEFSQKYLNNENILLQYFLISQMVGVNEYIVYNSYKINDYLKFNLLKNNIKLNLLPYNFPYSLDGMSEKNSLILEIDCNLRNLNTAQYFMVMRPNEIFITESYLKLSAQLIKTLNNYTIENKFNLEVIHICNNNSQPAKFVLNNYLVDNTKKSLPKSIYRPFYKDDSSIKEVGPISKNLGFVFRYKDCSNSNSNHVDFVTTQVDYRSILTEAILNYIKSIELEYNKVTN